MSGQDVTYEFCAASQCPTRGPGERGSVLIDEQNRFWYPNPNGVGHSLSSVSGAGDSRALAPWFAGGYSGKRICWWGDSTTSQMHDVSVLMTSGVWFYSAAPKLAQAGVLMLNRGANGSSLAGAMSGNPTGPAGTFCGISDVAALACDAYVICFPINDCRQDASIIGSYGSAGHIAKALALQALFVSAAAQIRAVKSNAVIVWRMPNAHQTGSPFITTGVSAQNCMDVYRLTFRGDAALGVPALASLVAKSVTYDTLARWFNDAAYVSGTTPSNGRINADGLHPEGANAYIDFMGDLLQLFSDPVLGTVEESNTVAGAAATEVTRFGVAIRPTPGLVAMSEDYVLVGTATVESASSGNWQMSVGMDRSLSTSVAANVLMFWGAAGASGYGTSQVPVVSLDDIVVWSPAGLAQQVMPIRVMANNCTSLKMQWFSAPDGVAYLTAAQTPIGTPGLIYRRKEYGNPDFSTWLRRTTGFAKGALLPKAYPFSVVAASVASLEIRGHAQYGSFFDLTGKTVVVTDRVFLTGVTPSGGLLLTGATWTPHGSEPGRGTITGMTGVDFSKSPIKQGVLVSAT